MMTPRYRYYRDESECPFEEDSKEYLFWHAERTLLPMTFEDRFNNRAPGSYPDWCRNSGRSVEDWACASLVYDLVAKILNVCDVDFLNWDEYIKKEPVSK